MFKFTHTGAVIALVVTAVGLPPTGVRLKADEGMWTFDSPPTTQLRDRYGFTMTPAWLDHLRLSSVRFNDGGS
jgi:hypothetical protein